ncbi:MAG: hypothetical protein M3Q58_01535 [Bacteroidota bacterium]|nr:hypothetical protein [Bacteroidota bacterium]
MGGNNSANTSEQIGLKTDSDLSIITADTSRMEITREGDVKIKKDFYLEKHLGLINERRLIEITQGGKLSPLSTEQLISRLFTSDCWEAVPDTRDPLMSGMFMLKVPAWAYKSGVIYTGSTCPAKVGIGTDIPVQRLDVRGGGHFSGNLGIGITSPQHKLHVHNGNILLSGSSSSLLFDNGGSTWGNWGIEYDSNSGGLNFWKPSGSTGGFGNYFLFLKNNGKIGIGTNNPQANLHVVGDGQFTSKVRIGTTHNSGVHSNYALSVDGKIVAKSFYVTMSSWADYVFKPDYNLMPLNEVKDFINTHGHLNGILSEKEIIANGLNVTDMILQQQIKIEELYLYLIKTNEKLITLDLENNKLKQQILILSEKE